MGSQDGRFDIRPLTPDHHSPALKVIRTAIQAGAKQYYSESQIQAWIRSQSVGNPVLHCCVRVVVCEGEVVGVAGADLRNHYQLGFVFVAPSHWNSGLGRALVSCLERFCADGGIREIHVAAALNAVKFYAALGYTACGGISVLLPSETGGDFILLPAVSMCKEVE